MNTKEAAPLTHELLARKGEASAARWRSEQDGANSSHIEQLNPEATPRDTANGTGSMARSILVDRRFIVAALAIGIVSGVASYFLFARPTQETSHLTASTQVTPIPTSQTTTIIAETQPAENKQKNARTDNVAQERLTLLPASGPIEPTNDAAPLKGEDTVISPPYPTVHTVAVKSDAPAARPTTPPERQTQKTTAPAVPAPPPVVAAKPTESTIRQVEKQAKTVTVPAPPVATVSTPKAKAPERSGKVTASTAPEPAAPRKTASLAQPATKAEPTTKAATPLFSLQLASVKDRAAADRESLRLKKQHPDTLGTIEVSVVKASVANRGTFYRIKAGRFQSAKAANDMCKALKAKKQPCLVVRR